jgi:hypothetical protein
LNLKRDFLCLKPLLSNGSTCVPLQPGELLLSGEPHTRAGKAIAAALAMGFDAVGLMHKLTHKLESAWFQTLNLQCDITVSKCASKFNP